MKISFQIPYHTRWGEDVRILFSDGMVHPLYIRFIPATEKSGGAVLNWIRLPVRLN